MKTIHAFLLNFLIVLMVTLPVRAEVVLPQVIGSNMVFQRNKPIKVWGTAAKGEKVKVEFNGNKMSATPKKDGTWMVTFPAMSAGGPYTMSIKGDNSIGLDNIYIGDIWICSGQSNMQWILQNVNNAEEEIANADFPKIRIITIPRNAQLSPADDVPATDWQLCSPSTVPDFSAVAYFFGRNIYKETGIPIGLISTNWGGTNIEAWTSSDFLSTVPGFSDKIKAQANRLQENEKPKPNDNPSSLYNGMIHPLLKLAVKGAIWYQGESNAGRAYQYRTLHPLLIESWREKWNQPDLPFIFVQLANFKKVENDPVESDWAELREAQLMTLSKLDNTGMAVTIDIGEADNIHPRNKQDVGYRLALNALKIAYGRDIVNSGPLYDSVEFKDGKAYISFTSEGTGLMVRDKYGYVKGFAIAGADKKFKWAKAKVEGDRVVVWSEEVPDPVAVRYAWANNPDDANLYNKENLPASPFRTDDWPGVTENTK